MVYRGVDRHGEGRYKEGEWGYGRGVGGSSPAFCASTWISLNSTRSHFGDSEGPLGASCVNTGDGEDRWGCEDAAAMESVLVRRW